jgi:hypothetical protein
MVPVLAMLLLLPPASQATGYWGSGYQVCKSFQAGGATIYVSAKHLRCKKAGKATGYWGSGYQVCKSFQAGGATIYVSAKHLRCKKAGKVLREYFLAPESQKEVVGPGAYNGYVRLKRFPGWRCTSGAGAGGCRKGRKMAAYNTFHPRRSPYRRCGTIGSSAGWGYGGIRAYGVTCAAARHLLRTWSPSDPRGWKLRHGPVRDRFVKGEKRITGIPLGD